MNVRELSAADMEAAVAFARQHFFHPAGLDPETIVRSTLAQPLGRVVATENQEGLQALVHCFRKAPTPPFDNRFLFDIIAANRQRDGSQALDAALSVAIHKALVEANAPQTLFLAMCRADDTPLEQALRDAGFDNPEGLEAGQVLLDGACELPAPDGATIRPASPEDAARISEMSVAYVNPLDWIPASWVYGLLAVGAILVAEKEGHVVGVSGGMMLGKEQAIGLMNIAEPDYPFIGFALFNNVCVRLRDQGARYLLGMVESENHRLFYQRIGWQHSHNVNLWQRTVSRR